jgi:O-acetyl-ADP-ribose deacetylase (regulator of RNase III)
MITTINKDILTVDKGVIVHSVNCIGAVGGLAGAIARKWPENAKKYREYVEHRKSSIMLLGSVFEVNVAHNLFVANLFGQYNIGTSKQQTEYAALIAGFKKIADTFFYGDDTEDMYFGALGFESVSIVLTDIYVPYRIGCGLGGADWEKVQDILHQIFENSHKNVYICKHE